MAKIIVLQFDPQMRTPHENMTYICEFASNHRNALIILPELFLSSYSYYECIPFKEIRTILAPLIDLCKKNELCFVGSLPVSTPRGNYNRAIYLTGQRLYKKDKARLFGAEQSTMIAGKVQPIFLYQNIPFSLQVCLDIIDPLVIRKLVRRGVRLIINPATVSVDFLRTINKAQALENDIMTIFCNRCGAEDNGIQYLGRSSIFYADGNEETLQNTKGVLMFDA